MGDIPPKPPEYVYVEQPEVVYLGEPPPSNAVGIVGFITSMLGLVTCGLLSPIGFLISLCGLFKNPKGFASAGTILGLLGTLWLAIAGYAIVMGLVMAKSAVETGVQTLATAAALERGRAEVESYRQENGQLPDGIEGNKLVLDIKDGWERPIRYAPDEDDKYVMRSAGPDGEFHTDDDMTSDINYLDIEITSEDGETVRVGQSGIEIDSDDEKVLINGGGINVEDRDSKVEIQPGRIEGSVDGEEIRIDGASIKVEEGETKLNVDVPVGRVTKGDGED